MYKENEIKIINTLRENGLIYLKGELSHSKVVSVKCINGHESEGKVKDLVRRRICKECSKSKSFYKLRDTLIGYNYKVITTEDDYGGSESKIEYICDNNHYQNQTVRSIRKGSKCYHCVRYGAYERVINNFKKEGYTMITTIEEYYGVKTKVNYICNKGHNRTSFISDLDQGARCKTCSSEKLGEKLRLSLDYIVDYFNTNEYEVVNFLEYKDVNSRFTIKCKNNHKYDTSFANFKAGSRCLECSSAERAIRRKEKLEDIEYITLKKLEKKEYDKKYVQDNLEKIKLRSKKYYHSNLEKIKERERKRNSTIEYKKKRKKYLETRKERDAELNREWRNKNRLKVRELKKNRYHKQRSVEQGFTIEDWNECKSYFEQMCCYCGELDLELTQDHFIPVSKNGGYTKDNMLPACRSCNSSKQDTNFEEWYSWQDFYSEERETKLLNYLGYVLEKSTKN